MSKTRTSQNAKILRMLKNGRKLTVRAAQNYGIRNLTARISELRGFGYHISTNLKLNKDTKRNIGVYSL